MFKRGKKSPLCLGQAPESCKELSEVAEDVGALGGGFNRSLKERFCPLILSAPLQAEGVAA